MEAVGFTETLVSIQQTTRHSQRDVFAEEPEIELLFCRLENLSTGYCKIKQINVLRMTTAVL
jgi:hypothetical protein